MPESVPGAYPGASDEVEGDDSVARVQQLVLSSPPVARAVQVRMHVLYLSDCCELILILAGCPPVYFLHPKSFPLPY